jgi:hypothetical protein
MVFGIMIGVIVCASDMSGVWYGKSDLECSIYRDKQVCINQCACGWCNGTQCLARKNPQNCPIPNDWETDKTPACLEKEKEKEISLITLAVIGGLIAIVTLITFLVDNYILSRRS